MERNRKIRPARKQDLAVKAFQLLCEIEDTPYARSAKALVVKDPKRFLAIELEHPSAYASHETFRVDYLLKSFLSKYKGLETGIDTKRIAFSSFEAAERTCASTNARLRAEKSCFVDPVIHRAQYLIAKALGPLRLERLSGDERWGPGAATDMNRKRAYLDTKMVELPLSVTPTALPWLEKAIKVDLIWSELICGGEVLGDFSFLREKVFSLERGSRLDSVPKNAKTDRCICIEPRGNMFVQKAVGRFIRRVLRTNGIDLDDQGVNQELARTAQAHGLATIDLSMASDTIAKLLVRELLPIEWYIYLDSIRSHGYISDGVFAPFEKFSSMGNGFTFELESLLFWALAKASMADESDPLGVYGDDIIVPSNDAWCLITTLNYCGFSVNDEKSFIEGPFRESCGRHYFDGIDVTPVYQKEVVLEPHGPEHIRLLNRLKRYAGKHNDGDRCLPSVSTVWQELYRTVKFDWHPQIPLGSEGDDGYVVCHNDLRRVKPWRKSYGIRWNVLVRSVRSIPANELALYAYSLRQGCVTELPSYGNVISRSEEMVTFSKGDRWIEPQWQFMLEG